MLKRAWSFLDGFLEVVQKGAPRTAIHFWDGVMALIGATVAAAIAIWGAGQLGDVLYTEGSFNLWFQADNPRVIANLLDASSYQYRATVHPIFRS
jgi:hypothetical protein